MAVDFESLSDEQLQSLLNQPSTFKKQAAPDFESMSDEELQAALRAKPVASEKVGTTAEQEAIAAEENRARPRMTEAGEFLGGLGDIAGAIGNISATPDLVRMYRGVREALANPEQRNVPGVLGALISSSPALQAGIGATRAAFSPFARLSNLSTSAAQVVSDLLQKAGLTTGADVAGAGTQVALDAFAIPRLLRSLGKVGYNVTRTKFPLVAEKTAAITARGAKEEATLSELADKEIKIVGEAAVKQKADIANLRIETERLTQDAPTAKAVGEQFQQNFKIKKAESAARFSAEYNNLIDEGSSLKSSVPGYKKMAESVFEETGTTKILPTKAEKEAGKIKRALTLEDELDTTYGDVRSVLSKPDSPEVNKFAEAVRAARIKAGEIVEGSEKQLSVGELILDRQKLKRAERAATDVNQGQVAIQLGKLRKGIEGDISEFQNISTKLKDVDTAYATEHAPFYSYGAPAREAAEGGVAGVIDRLVPKAGDPNRVEKLSSLKILDDKTPVQKAWLNEGVFEANKSDDFGKAIVKHWDKFSEPGDEVLRALLDDKYVQYANIVDRFRKLKPKNIENMLDTSIKEISKRTSTGIEASQIEKTKSLQGTLEEADVIASTIFERASERIKKIETERDLAIKATKKSIEKDIKKITGEPFTPRRAQGYGMLLIIGGGAAVGTGQLALGGLALAKGGLMMLGADQVSRIINTAKGASLINRAIRTVPGTAQAAATARQIQTYLRDLDQVEGQQQP